MELDRPNNRAVIVDTGSPTRPIGASEREQLTNDKLPGRLGIEIFGQSWTECEQANNCNRLPRNHVVRPWSRGAPTVQRGPTVGPTDLTIARN
jgi:hypothetical protein